MEAVARSRARPIRLRGRSYVAFVFFPVVPVIEWLEEIDATLRQSPGFFAGKPVVLDLSAVDLSQNAITQLISNLEQRGLRVLGIEGVDAERLSVNLPPLLTGGRLMRDQRRNARRNPRRSRSRHHCCSIRKCAPVSRSCFPMVTSRSSDQFRRAREIVAGGSIYVYGTLRGRAMAGINGKSDGANLLPENRSRAFGDRRLLPEPRKRSMPPPTLDRRRSGLNGDIVTNHPFELVAWEIKTNGQSTGRDVR